MIILVGVKLITKIEEANIFYYNEIEINYENINMKTDSMKIY